MSFDHEVAAHNALNNLRNCKLQPEMFSDGWARRAIEEFNYQINRTTEYLTDYFLLVEKRLSDLEEKLAFLSILD